MTQQLDNGSGDASTISGNLTVAGTISQTTAGPTASAVGSAVASTAATNSTPYGYAQAQADAIVARLNEVRTAVLQIQTALIAAGMLESA